MHHLQTITQKEMSRKEFLTLVGLAGVSIFGFANVLRLLKGQAKVGYGSSAYGGKR